MKTTSKTLQVIAIKYKRWAMDFTADNMTSDDTRDAIVAANNAMNLVQMLAERDEEAAKLKLVED